MTGERSHVLIGQDAWTEHLRDIFQSLDISSGTLTDNVSTSVAMYCRHCHPRGLRHDDLVLLIARAFCSINEKALAERALGSVKPHARHKARWLEILSELHSFPSLLPYFSLGIIRPADWAGARLDRMWILDLGRLRLSEAEKHEMLLYGSLRAMIENMGVFWDAAGGEGVLGLKGLASFNVESNPRQRQTFTSTDDLLGYIGNLFLQQQKLRNWQAVPSLLNLDI
jgi:hypothetical protein